MPLMPGPCAAGMSKDADMSKYETLGEERKVHADVKPNQILASLNNALNFRHMTTALNRGFAMCARLRSSRCALSANAHTWTLAHPMTDSTHLLVGQDQGGACS